MKSLDEVITAVHHCGLLTSFDDTYEYEGDCPYEDCSKCEQKRMLGKDIIQYLAAYKDDKNELTALRAYWAEQQANPALTWDELKAMEGKPVWIETEPINGWVIVEIRGSFMKGREYIKFGLLELSNKDLGKTWQAYKKERNEDLRRSDKEVRNV